MGLNSHGPALFVTTKFRQGVWCLGSDTFGVQSCLKRGLIQEDGACRFTRPVGFKGCCVNNYKRVISKLGLGGPSGIKTL